MAYEGWAIVELMGHRQRAGRVSEVEQYGAKLLCIEIPTFGDEGEDTGGVTEFYGGSAIYGIHPAEEAVAREAARRIGNPRPVQPLAYLAPPGQRHDYEDDFD